MQNFGGTNKEYYGIFEVAYLVVVFEFVLIIVFVFVSITDLLRFRLCSLKRI